MKNIFGFFAWQWGRLETWHKIYLAAVATVLLSVALDKPYNTYASYAGAGVMVLVALKWFVWDIVGDSYRNYRREKEKIFDIIKDPSK